MQFGNVIKLFLLVKLKIKFTIVNVNAAHDHSHNVRPSLPEIADLT